MLSPSDDFSIGGVSIAPGEEQFIDLPITNLYHTPLSMPVRVRRGRKAGPIMFISAALHGDELNGVEIIRRVLGLKHVKSLRGCLIAVPIVNVQAFLIQSRYLPDRRDLNRSFPGSETGSLAARMANVFLKQIVGQADYGIDLHTGAIHRPNLPQIRADMSHAKTRELAEAFAAPVIMNAPVRPGSLREYTSKNQIPVLLYESGEALRFDEYCVRTGVRGVVNVMRSIGMLPPSKRQRKWAEPVFAQSSFWLRAPASGILRSLVNLGEWVKAEQTIAMIADPYGQTETPVVASEAGLVIGRTNLPPVNEGDALFHIARVDAPHSAAETVERFQADTARWPSESGEPPVV
ncbi:MAG: M14 family metallopeptidase [Salinisphaeraceae bacterium]|nr:M14 family metallopeptidase [Salinisphaeraceae bacterium]